MCSAMFVVDSVFAFVTRSGALYGTLDDDFVTFLGDQYCQALHDICCVAVEQLR
jgi:hypothetical protein